MFIMNDEIDSGKILYRKKYSVTGKESFDFVIDPAVRTKCFLDFFGANWGGNLSEITSVDSESNIFFIIHPVLKHFSILGMEKIKK